MSSNGKDLKYSMDIYHPTGEIEKDVRAYGLDMESALKRVKKTKRSENRQKVISNNKQKISNFWRENAFVVIVVALMLGVIGVDVLTNDRIYTIYSVATMIVLSIISGLIIYRK